MTAALLLSSLITGGARILTGAQACWVGCGPGKAQRIYFANHTSHLDFVLILASLPRPLRSSTRPVAAIDYWSKTRLRRHLANHVFHAVMIDRARAHSAMSPVAPMMEALDDGYSLILFPEGTRNTGDELLPFRAGIFNLAVARPEIDIVPVWMSNAWRIMPKGSLLPIPLLCSIVFGEPLRVSAGESKAEFLERLRGALIDLKNRGAE